MITEIVREHSKKAGIGALLLILFVLYLTFEKEEAPLDQGGPVPSVPQPAIEENKKRNQEDAEPKTSQEIWVDVKGEVVKPGVYKALSGKRVIHFIQLAGGFKETADPKSVNLAAIATDEMVIYAAKEGEQSALPVQQEQGAGEGVKSAVVNVNSATEEQLMELPGVGPAKAQAIISYREENGPFSSMEDLLQVKGIGEKTAEQWAEQISFTH